MADKNESTMKWKVDITQLKAAIQDAKRSISTANAEFKAATAGMDKWQNSTTGLEAKLKQLNTTLPQQKAILTQLEKQYELTAKELGESSSEAQKLKIQIENQKGAIAKTEASIAKYTSDLDEMNSATGKLTKTISEQEKELDKLKSAYSDTVIEFGKDSKEAQDLARQIENLSTELNNNKKTLQDAKSSADQFDNSLDKVGKEAKDTEGDIGKLDGGFTILKGTMANLAADAIKGIIRGFKDVGKAAVDAVNDIAKSGDEIDKESQKLQISAELYQKLAYAMDMSGSSIGDISKGIKNITNELAKAEKGTKDAGAQFEELGITLKNTDGTMKDAETVLMETIDALANMENETQRNKTANDIFGKSYSELLPLLNEGSDGIHALMQEAEDYGMVMSNDAVKASAEYDDSLTRLDGTVKGIKTRIVQEFLPSLTEIADGFSEMANGSDKGAEKVNKGFETMWKKITRMARKYAPETSSVVIPVLEKMYGMISKVVTYIVKNFSKIAPVVMGAVTAFTALKAAMAITTAITACKTAIAGLEAGVGLATKAQTLWNAAMAANPIGAVITAVAALTAAIVLLASAQSEGEKIHQKQMDQLEEMKEKIDANAESWNNLKTAQQEQMSAGMSEIGYLDSLKSELQEITDENGKVKKGYEERASFITDQLSQALGIEIETNDGVIQKYKEIIETIDQVMEKKKAQIILDSQESLYKEAITQQGEALQNLNKIQDERLKKQEEVKNAESAYWATYQSLQNAVTIGEKDNAQQRLDSIQKVLDMRYAEMDQLNSNYNQQAALVEEYAYNIGTYEKNMELAHAERYDEMSTSTWNYVKDFQNAEDAQKAIQEEQIKTEETNLAILKSLRDKSGSDIYDAQIKQSEKRLAELKEGLNKYTSTTTSELDKTTIQWKKGLDEQLSELTGKKIEFRGAGTGLVQMYADGVAIGAPQPKEEMTKCVTDVINEISKNETGAEEAGKDLIEGFNNGIANEKVQNGAFATVKKFGEKLLSELKKSLKEQSPSKATEEMGIFLDEGLTQGIIKGKEKTLKQASLFGKSVLESVKGELGEGIDTSNLLGVKKSLSDSIGSLKTDMAVQNETVGGSFGASSGDTVNSKQVNVTYNQTINSPKAVDGMTIYRQTNSLLFATKVGLNNV